MKLPEKKCQQDLDQIRAQIAEGIDKFIETICTRIRENPPGEPLILKFAREVPTQVAMTLTSRAIDRTEGEGYQIYGLIIDFEQD